MKKYTFFRKGITIGILMLFFCTSLSVTSVEVQNNQNNNNATIPNDECITMTYTFERPTITMIASTKFARVEIPGLLCSAEKPGEPLLPVKQIQTLLPSGKTVKNVDIILGQEILVASNINVEPKEQPVPLNEGAKTILPTPNPFIYTSRNPYPEKTFVSVGISKFRGYDINFGGACPFKYIPAAQQLYFYPQITLVFHLQNTPVIDSGSSLYRSGVDEQDVLEKVDNDDTNLAESYRDVEQRHQPVVRGYDLLIITTPELKNGFQRLAWAHNTEGLRTIIKTIGQNIPNGSTVNQTCENIRNCIRNAYQNLGISYVLLGGDMDVVPAPYLYFGYEGSAVVKGPSDFYYACLDGPFNSGGNLSRWGEACDGENGGDVDLLAEVNVGRACVGNMTEVGHFVNKTLKYLREPFMLSNDAEEGRGDYLRNVVMAGELLTEHNQTTPLTYGDPYIIQLEQFFPRETYTISTLYDSEWQEHNWTVPHLYGQGGWPKELLINLINNGTHFINHLGHSGNYYNMKLITPEVRVLTNNKLCFVYSQGCSAGAFDQNTCYDLDCIVEWFTIKTEHGAFAGIWNTRDGWSGASSIFHYEFLNAVFRENISIISEANQNSKTDNIYQIKYNDPTLQMRWTCYQLNLFGDPTLSFKNRPIHVNTNGPYNGSVNESVQFKGTVYSATYPYTWSWNFGDGTTSAQKNPIHRYLSDGVYNVTLTVRDNRGCTDTHSTTATIDIFVDAHGPYTGKMDEPIQFNGLASSGYLPYNWSWDFGDQIGGSYLQNPSYSYLSPGEFVAILTVTDNRGNKGNSTAQVTVRSSFIYVDADASPGGTGSLDHPYQKIQDGINHVIEGGTVYAYTGTYHEDVIVNKRVDLVGQTRSNTIIDGGPQESDYVVKISSPWVNMSNFTIQTKWSTGIKITTDNNRVFDNNIHYYPSGANICGISLQNSCSNNVIMNNYISGSVPDEIIMTGIEIYSSQGNFITQNYIDNVGIAVNIVYSYQNTISQNDIFLMHLVGIPIGIQLLESQSNTIMKNTIKEKKGVVIQSYLSCYNLIYHNNFINTHFYAFLSDPNGDDGQIIACDDDVLNYWNNSDSSIGGNYWSTWYCQGDPTNDPEEAYWFDDDNVDWYPFQNPNGWN